MNGALWILGAAAALLVLGVAAELGARLWLHLRGGYYVWPPGFRLHLHLDPEVFPELPPRARIEINADGERGGTVPKKGKRLYRVLVAGGSPVECALLDQPTSWPGVLERLLKAPEHFRALGAPNVHVGNIGLSGVRSHTLNLIFERVLPRYRHLDAIVVMVGGNDVSHWLANGTPASIDSSPVAMSEAFSCHPEKPFAWTPGALAMVELLQRLPIQWLHPVKVRTGSGKWIGKARAMRARATDIRTTVPDPAPMLNFFEEQFRELLRKAKRHADRVLVVRQPWFEKNDYTAEELAHFWCGAAGVPQREEVSTYYSIQVFYRLMASVDSRAIQVADELGVAQLNLMPLLEPTLKTYYDSIHFTPAGAATVAEAVAAVLLQRARWPSPLVGCGSSAPRAATMSASITPEGSRS